MRLDQPLDMVGGPVEALGHRRHLVAAVRRHAGHEIATAPGIHAHAQPLQPAGQVTHHRIGGQPDDTGDQSQVGERIAAGRTEGPRHARSHRAAVGQFGHHGMKIARAVAPRLVENVARKRAADACDQPAARVVYGNVGAEGP